MKLVKSLEQYDINGDDLFLIIREGKYYISAYAEDSYIPINKEVIQHILKRITELEKSKPKNSKT